MGLKLDPEGYIILDITHSFHGISRDSPENLRKLLSPRKFDEKAGILLCETYGNHYPFRKEYDGSIIILLLKRAKG